MNRPAISPAPPSRALRAVSAGRRRAGAVVLPGRSRRRADAASARRGWRWPRSRCCPAGSGSVSRSVSATIAIDDTFSSPPRCCSGRRPATLAIAAAFDPVLAAAAPAAAAAGVQHRGARIVDVGGAQRVLRDGRASSRWRSGTRRSRRWSLPLLALAGVYFALNSG